MNTNKELNVGRITFGPTNVPNATMTHYQLQTALAERNRALADCEELKSTIRKLCDALQSWHDLYSEKISGTEFNDMLINIERISAAVLYLVRLDEKNTNTVEKVI